MKVVMNDVKKETVLHALRLVKECAKHQPCKVCGNAIADAFAAMALGDGDPPREVQQLIEKWRAEEQRLCRMADGQGQTQYAERLAAKADAYGSCADELSALLTAAGRDVTKAELAEHVRAIQRAVEAQLPEDEPDCVQPWVYETAVKTMAQRLTAAGSSSSPKISQAIEDMDRAKNYAHGQCGSALNCRLCAAYANLKVVLARSSPSKHETQDAFVAGWNARGDACYPTPIDGELTIALRQYKTAAGSSREDATCEACDAGYRLADDGIHYNDASGGWTWGVCRKVVAKHKAEPAAGSSAPPLSQRWRTIADQYATGCGQSHADYARALQDCADQLDAERGSSAPPQETVTRFEVIDENGRIYVCRPCSIELSYQDQGRTLKVFVTPGSDRSLTPESEK